MPALEVLLEAKAEAAGVGERSTGLVLEDDPLETRVVVCSAPEQERADSGYEWGLQEWRGEVPGDAF